MCESMTVQPASLAIRCKQQNWAESSFKISFNVCVQALQIKRALLTGIRPEGPHATGIAFCAGYGTMPFCSFSLSIPWAMIAPPPLFQRWCRPVLRSLASTERTLSALRWKVTWSTSHTLLSSSTLVNLTERCEPSSDMQLAKVDGELMLDTLPESKTKLSEFLHEKAAVCGAMAGSLEVLVPKQMQRSAHPQSTSSP